MTEETSSAATLNESMLQFHAGASTIDMVAFRLWSLAVLSSRLGFDGAIWGYTEELAASHFHRTEAAALEGAGGQAVLSIIRRAPPGKVVTIDIGAFAEHSRAHGFRSAMSVRCDHTEAERGQFIVLRRGSGAEPFDNGERSTFELLAPHMLLAHATCRKLQLVTGANRSTQAPVRASALAGRTGWLHENDARFVRTLRQEWPDWVGRRLPDALVNHKARKVASRWQFLGRQIVIDFSPINELMLLTARPRLPADALTTREWDIARRYASGSDFREVAEALQVAPATVRSHLRRVFSKLNVRNKAQLSASLE